GRASRRRRRPRRAPCRARRAARRAAGAARGRRRVAARRPPRCLTEEPRWGAAGAAPHLRPARYGVAVSVVTTCVWPGVWSDVMVATLCQVPAFLLEMSYGIVTWPPGVGPVRTGRYSEPSAGAEPRLTPLEPSRFSTPQLIA